MVVVAVLAVDAAVFGLIILIGNALGPPVLPPKKPRETPPRSA